MAGWAPPAPLDLENPGVVAARRVGYRRTMSLGLSARSRLSVCSVVAALVCGSLGACGGDAPKPGFEDFGGSGGGSGKTSSTTKTASATSTHASSSTVTVAVAASSSSSTTSSTGTGCVDTGPGEQNGTELTAYDLGTIGDCDNMGDVVSGVLNGASDVDWYQFHGVDISTFPPCSVDPSRTLTSSGPVRICKFIQCDGSESNNFSCPSGSSAANSPDGRPGCCSATGMNFSLTCGSSQLNADNARVFMRVDNPQALPCPSYTVAYHY